MFGSLTFSLSLSLVPLHLNKVAGIVGRADLLCALFFQLSFLTYCKAFNRGRYLTLTLSTTLYVYCYSVLYKGLFVCADKYSSSIKHRGAARFLNAHV